VAVLTWFSFSFVVLVPAFDREDQENENEKENDHSPRRPVSEIAFVEVGAGGLFIPEYVDPIDAEVDFLEVESLGVGDNVERGPPFRISLG